jgi:uncharacterized membrane protein
MFRMAKKAASLQRYQGVFYAIVLANATSIWLLLLRMVEARNVRYGFFPWNLLLAWLPLLFAWALIVRLKRTRWLDPINLLLSVLWLGFLPNSFYLVTDLIHLKPTGEVSLLYDAVLFCSFIFNAYIAGIISLYLVHRQLFKRLDAAKAHAIIVGVLLACGFAIHLGRTLRWNTWDVIINPIGLSFDIIDRLIRPASYPQAFITTIIFFALIGSVYIVVWQVAAALRGADNA